MFTDTCSNTEKGFFEGKKKLWALEPFCHYCEIATLIFVILLKSFLVVTRNGSCYSYSHTGKWFFFRLKTQEFFENGIVFSEWLNNTSNKNIRCKKLATIISGRKYEAGPFVLRKQEARDQNITGITFREGYMRVTFSRNVTLK